MEDCSHQRRVAPSAGATISNSLEVSRNTKVNSYRTIQQGRKEGGGRKVEVYEAAMEWDSVENDTAAALHYYYWLYSTLTRKKVFSSTEDLVRQPVILRNPVANHLFLWHSDYLYRLYDVCRIIHLNCSWNCENWNSGWGLTYFWVGYHTPKGGAGRLFKTVAHQNDDVKGDQQACSVSHFFLAVLSYAPLRCSDICQN